MTLKLLSLEFFCCDLSKTKSVLATCRAVGPGEGMWVKEPTGVTPNNFSLKATIFKTHKITMENVNTADLNGSTPES